MKKKIKVFTTGVGPETAGEVLTKKIEEFIMQENIIDIISCEADSNKWGWMIVLIYNK